MSHFIQSTSIFKICFKRNIIIFVIIYKATKLFIYKCMCLMILGIGITHKWQPYLHRIHGRSMGKIANNNLCNSRNIGYLKTIELSSTNLDITFIGKLEGLEFTDSQFICLILTTHHKWKIFKGCLVNHLDRINAWF